MGSDAGEAPGGAVSGEEWCPAHASAASPVSAGTTPRAGAAHGPFLGHVWGQPDLSAFGRVLLTSPFSFISDYVIDDKVAVLQKRDHEGFGFVLRGAKGNDEGGVPLVRVSLELGPCPSPLLASCLAPAPLPLPTPFLSPCGDSLFWVWDVGRRQQFCSLPDFRGLC